MRKVLFRLFLLALIGGSVTSYFIWNQATKLPDEYLDAVAANTQDSQSLPIEPSQIASQATVSRNKITQPIAKAKIGQKVDFKLTERDLNNLILDKLAASQTDRQIPSGIRGINTSIKDGKIHTGALINLDKLTRDAKPGTKAAGLTKLTEKLPFLKDRDVYLGIVGKPMFDGKQIEFDESTQVKVGNMNFTISQIAENLGVSPDKIQQAIDLNLRSKSLKIDRIDLQNDGLKIEGAKQ
jgi:hypothetical protein